MATVETQGRRLVRADRRAEGASRARALLRREGDQAARGGVRRAPDPCRGHHRQGARGGPDEPAPARVARGPRALGVRRDARRRGAQLGLLGDRHVDSRERPRGRPDSDRRHRGAEASSGWRRSSRRRCSAASASRSRAPARTSPGSRRRPSARATTTSSTARRCSSRTPGTRRGSSASPPPNPARGTGAFRPS